MIEYCSLDQISEIKQCYHVGILQKPQAFGGLGLTFKKEKKNCQRDIFLLEIRNLYLDLHQTWHDFAQPQEENFQSLGSARKNVTFDIVTFFFARRKIAKIYTLPDSTGNQLSRFGWIEFDIEMLEMWDHIEEPKMSFFCTFLTLLDTA